MRRGHIFLRRRGAFPKEELLHLMNDHFLILLARRIQPVFVEQHLAVLCPLGPGLLRYVLIDFLSEFAVERRLGKPRQLLFQFRAEDSMFSHIFQIIAQLLRIPGSPTNGVGMRDNSRHQIKRGQAGSSNVSPCLGCTFLLTNRKAVAISSSRTAAHTTSWVARASRCPVEPWENN